MLVAMTPGGLLIGTFRKGESLAADLTGRLTGTPIVLGSLLKAERVTLQALRSTSRLRSGAIRVLMLPTTSDVAEVRRELERVRSSLAEIEARLDDRSSRDGAW